MTINFQTLIDALEKRLEAVQTHIKDMTDEAGNISIGDMFQTQMLMNNMTQISEMSTSVVSASNTALASMCRNVKG